MSCQICLNPRVYEQHEEVEVFEPVSTTVLEQCDIPEHGKFLALSNGQVRISFIDRTCLDMTADFSKRLAPAEGDFKVCMYMYLKWYYVFLF